MYCKFLDLLVLLALNICLVGLWRQLALTLRVVDVPGGPLKLHHKTTPYLGGMAIFTAFWLNLWWLEIDKFNVFFGGLVTVLLLGLLDDIFVLSPWQKLLGQGVVAGWLVFAGVSIPLGFSDTLNGLAGFIWLVVLMNAFNLVDVMDGLAGTMALGSSVAFWLFSMYLQQIDLQYACLAILLSLGAFLAYNLPRATIYLGDTGSMFLGAILGVLSLNLGWQEVMGDIGFGGIRIFAALFILFAIPLVELCSLIIIRYMKGIPFYRGSRDHFSHYLQARGWTVWQILGLIAVGQISLFLVSIWLVVYGLSLWKIILMLLSLLFIWLKTVFATTPSNG